MWVALAVALDLYGGAQVPHGTYDHVVVAGAGVRPGGIASDALRTRTRRAVDLWAQGVAPGLALTGGVGDWPPAEAIVARDLAVGWGVPPDAIVLEDQSTSTAGNADELFAVTGDRRILVVTDRSHVFRCRRVFARRYTEVDAVGSTSPPFTRARIALREVLAITWYLVSGKL